MNPELSLLKVLLRKDSFKTYYEYIDLKHLKDVYKEVYYLYLSLECLHSSVEKDLTLDELEAFFHSKYPDADKEAYTGLLETLRSLDIGEEVGEVLLASMKRRKDALKLSEDLFKISQGLEVESLTERLQTFGASAEKVDHNEYEPVTTNLEELLERAYTEQGCRWRLSCLNKSLGSLRKGDFGFIFARPETGKTTFLASETTQFLSNGTTKVVWFNNEEQSDKVMLRVYQAFFGISLDQLNANRKKFDIAFNEQTQGRFRLYDATAFDRKILERIIERDSPDVVIYDQLTKVKGFKADRNDLELGDKFQWARELAKGRHAAIGVSQADGNAEGIRYLTMDHVANVKTAVQAEADWILGIGRDKAQELENVRYLNISKNKLYGDSDSLPELRHGRFTTLINPSIARYEDTIEYA